MAAKTTKKGCDTAGEALRLNGRYVRESRGEEEALLRAVSANLRGRISFSTSADLAWKVAAVCAAYHRARVLIVAAVEGCAAELCWDLDRHLGDGVGLLTPRHVKHARCQVTTRSLFPQLGSGWHVLLPVVFHRRHLSEAACQAVACVQAPRLYTLSPGRLGMGERTRLRLEAVSGPLIYPSGAETTAEV